MEAGLIWVHILSHDLESGSDITPYNKINKALAVYRTDLVRLCKDDHYNAA